MATEEAYRDFMVVLVAEVAVATSMYARSRSGSSWLRPTSRFRRNRLNWRTIVSMPACAVSTSPRPKPTWPTLAFLPQLRLTRTQEVNRLASLIGAFSADLEERLAPAGAIPLPPETAAVGLPAEVIRLRPDIRAAERSLAAQTARIGVAEADLYPRLTLNGSFNLLSTRSGDLLDSAARDYGFGPALRWNLFSAGRVRSQIAIEESRTREAYYAYENAVLLAVEEVEVSMSGIANGRERLEALARGADSARETVSLVKENYTRGLVNVLDAERTLTTTEDAEP